MNVEIKFVCSVTFFVLFTNTRNNVSLENSGIGRPVPYIDFLGAFQRHVIDPNFALFRKKNWTRFIFIGHVYASYYKFVVFSAYKSVRNCYVWS